MKQLARSIVFGVVGFVLAWGGWHLYLDHQTFHALLNALQQQARTAAQPVGPDAAPAGAEKK